MKKTYVLDTNVLIQAPYAVECFEENTVVLPMTVLEELDNMKKEEGEKGANVRKVIRILDAHREKGNLLEGVRMEWGGTLRVEKNYRNVELPPDLPEHKSDNRILKVCVGLSNDLKEQVILVTKDILLRIKAQLLGIQAEDFGTEQVAVHEEQYLGRENIMKENLKLGIILCLITSFAGVFLGFANEFTKEVIAQNAKLSADDLKEILPKANKLEDFAFEKNEDSTISEVFQAKRTFFNLSS